MALSAGASAGLGAAAAARTSSPVIVPLGPVPRIWLMSTPCSSAKRRAFGEILGPPSGGFAGVARCGSLGTACSCVARAEAAMRTGIRRRRFSRRDDPGDGFAHGHHRPSRCRTPARMPSAGASSSTTTLSVSISSSGSPLVTVSPSCFRQASSFAGFLRHFERGHHDANGHNCLIRRIADTPTRSVCALASIISTTRRLGGASVSRVVGSGPSTVK